MDPKVLGHKLGYLNGMIVGYVEELCLLSPQMRIRTYRWLIKQLRDEIESLQQEEKADGRQDQRTSRNGRVQTR